MDIQLSTLQSTLAAISSLHASHASSQKRPTPFTSAVLNLERHDVLRYIRDADPLDAALFVYPPVPELVSSGGEGALTGAERAGTSRSGTLIDAEKAGRSRSSASNSAVASTSTSTSTVMTDDPTQLLVPRLPEPKQFLPPTPLRATASERSNYSAKSLLHAARKLVELHHHHAPRARKHIQALEKHRKSLVSNAEKLKSEMERAQVEVDRLTKLGKQGGAQAAVLAPAAVAPPAAPANDAVGASTSEQNEKEARERLVKLEEEHDKEEMEVMALQEMHKDLQDRRAALLRTRQAQARAKAAETATATATAERGERTASRSESSVMETSDEVDMTVRAQDEQDSTMSASGADLDDASISGAEPESSDELERVTENIWTAMGDVLRCLKPESESAPFAVTLKLLQSLVGGARAVVSSHQPGGGGGGGGDTSVNSVATGTTGTSVSATGSTASAPATLSVTAPTPTTMHACYILSSMLSSPAPHALDMSALKSNANDWWAASGRENFVKGGGAGNAEGMDESGESLTTKAIYQLVAQRIVRPKHVGGGRILSFA